MTTTAESQPKPQEHEHIVKTTFTYTIADAGTPIRCPVCAGEPIGVEQTFVARCDVTDNEDGTFSYDGEGTDTDSLWDSAEEVMIGGEYLLLCEACHYFIHRDFEIK